MKLRGEKCVKDVAVQRNVSNGRQFMQQVFNTVDVTVCHIKHNELWLILMYASNSLGNTPSLIVHIQLAEEMQRP